MMGMGKDAPLRDRSRATLEDEEDELACSLAPMAEPELKVRQALLQWRLALV